MGVDLKAAAIIMMDAFCCCSYVSKILQGKKVPIDGIKLLSCFVFIVRYHGCLGVQSQGRAIGFPHAVISWRNVDHHWLGSHRETDGCVSQLRDCAEFFRKEVLLASGCRSECGC